MSDDGKFGCDGCGKQYRWKAELAGKKVKCKCGHVMVVPDALDDGGDLEMFELADEPGASPAAPPPPPKPKPPVQEDASPDSVASKLGAGSHARLDPSGSQLDAYSLSGDSEVGMDAPVSPGGPCPGCGNVLADGAVLCINCGFNTQTGQKLGGASVAMDGGDDSPKKAGGAMLGGMLSKMKGSKPSDEAISMGDAADDKLWKGKQVIIPAALVVIGLVLRVLITRLDYDPNSWAEPPSMAAALIGTVFFALISTALLVGAAFLTATIMGMSFGSLPKAILKFAAVVLAPTSIAGLAAYFAGPDWGIFVGFPIEIGLYIFLLFWLFDLDVMEVFVLVAISWVIQNFIMAFILAMFMTAFM